MKRRSKTWLLAVCLVVFIMSTGITAFAADVTDTWESGNTIVTLNSDGVINVTAKSGTDGRMEDYAKTPPWYSARAKIVEVHTNEGVKYVSKRAFASLGNLSKVILNNDLEELGDKAFYANLKITELDIPKTVTRIGYQCFASARIEKLVIDNPECVIDTDAFEYCIDLKELYLNVKSVDFYNETTYPVLDDFTLIAPEITVGYNTTLSVRGSNKVYIETESFPHGYVDKQKPFVYSDNPVSVKAKTYGECALVGVPSVRVLESDQITKLEKSAFSFNKSVTFDKDLTGLQIVGDNGLADNQLNTNLFKPIDGVLTFQNLTSVGMGGFGKTYAAATPPPDDIRKIAFSQDVTIGTVAFSAPRYPNGYDPSYLTRNVEEIVFGGAAKIGRSAFAGNTKLERVDGNEISFTGADVFQGATGLKQITGTNMTVGSGALENLESLETISASTLQLENLAFSGSTKLREVRGTVMSLKDNAFSGCSALESVDLDDSIVAIPAYSFNNCTNLRDIGVKRLTAVGRYALRNTAVDMSTIDLSGLTTIGDCGLMNVNASLSDFGNITQVGKDGLMNSNSNIPTVNTDMVTLGDGALCGNGITDLTVEGNGVFNPKAYDVVETLTVSTNAKQFSADLSGWANLTRINWIGGVSASMTKANIPSTARVFCLDNSAVKTWCENQGVPYSILSDEEADVLIKGKLPTLLEDSKLFDASSPENLVFTVSLGKKPAGATGISKVVVDNDQLVKEEYSFNGVDSITVLSSYLVKLPDGAHTVSVQFDNGTFRSGASIIVINSKEQGGGDLPPDALTTITYEFYKDYPDYVIIPVQLNGATGITQLRVGTTELTEEQYELQDSAIILDKDLLIALDAGKYRVLPTFNDKANTTIPNIQLIIYNRAADRAAPYLLQSRIVFDGNPVVLKFDFGVGDLQATSVLALILDDDVILPTGERIPFTKRNVRKVQKAYTDTLEIIDEDEVIASPSDATPSNATPSNATYARATERDELVYATENSASSRDVFYVVDDEITLDSEYLASLKLTEGDHLIGAIFDNTERTTDVKKVILTIPKSDDVEEPDVPDINPDPDVPDIKPDPDVPDIKPDPIPDSGSHSGSGGGGGSHSKPSDKGDNSRIPDNGGHWEGSGNDWTYILPDGTTPINKWVGDGENWYYIDSTGKLVYDWFCDPATGRWYMLNREHNGKFGAALKGWYYEMQDGKWYFLTPSDYSMFTGWGYIDKEWYYFSATPEGVTYLGNNESGWKFNTATALRPYGSMYENENTPDGYFVDASGKYRK